MADARKRSASTCAVKTKNMESEKMQCDQEAPNTKKIVETEDVLGMGKDKMTMRLSHELRAWS